jgi:hypothetical protein
MSVSLAKVADEQAAVESAIEVAVACAGEDASEQ